MIGMVGILPEACRAGRLGFVEAGHEIALVGPFAPCLEASELAKLRGEPLPGELPEIDLAAVMAAQAAVREAVSSGRLASAHDIAEGGLAVALAECALAGGLGASVHLDAELLAELGGVGLERALFGEGPGGFIVSGTPGEILMLAAAEAPARPLGTVGGEALEITLEDASESLRVELSELSRAHGALGGLLT